MTFAYNHHLCRGCGHLIGPPFHHGLKELPAFVFFQFQESLVNSGDNNLAPCRRLLSKGDFNTDLRLHGLTNLICFFVCDDFNLQFVGLPPHIDLGNTKFVGGPAWIEEGRRLTFSDATPDR